MSELTTDVAKQYILHGEAEGLRWALAKVGNIGSICADEEDDLSAPITAYEELEAEVLGLYQDIVARLKHIEESVKNSG